MKRARAERYYVTLLQAIVRESLFCPLCDFVAGNHDAIINHLVDNHSDEEAIGRLGWVNKTL